jgi:tetratricopeptide (TPR) repeat protein
VIRHLLLVAPLLLTQVGCTSPEVVKPPATASKLPNQTVAPVQIVGYTTSELLADLERAHAYLLVDKFDEAATAFDRLVRLAKDPAIVAVARFNSGVAYEGLGKRDVAVRRYRELVEQQPDQPIARAGHVRLTRQLGYLERWQDLGDAADALLLRKDLSALDRIEAHGARALALVEQGDLDKARLAVGKAQELIDKHRLGKSSVPPVQLAQVSFAEGEIRRLKSEQIKLTPVPPNFPEVLEARCQGLLDAQSAYTEAMRSLDAHWSAMAGYRVGQLYQQLHREAMEIPAPKHANKSQAQLFEAAMRLRYSILLEKGLKMMDGTVRLGERTGEDSYWITRAREAVHQLQESLAAEKAALAKVPYTEAEIRAALDKLKADAQAKKP